MIIIVDNKTDPVVPKCTTRLSGFLFIHTFHKFVELLYGRNVPNNIVNATNKTSIRTPGTIILPSMPCLRTDGPAILQ